MFIQLSRGYEALVDDDMYEELVAFKWHSVVTTNHTYARRCTNGTYMYMHHQVLRIDPKVLRTDDLLVDHRDRDSLNNTRDNLWITTRDENARNSTAYKNRDWVYFHKQSGKYCVVYKGMHLGQYRTHEEASVAARRIGL
jgi:hypothetical protein